MEKDKINKIGFFTRNDNPVALVWEKKFRKWVKESDQNVKISDKNPQIVIALGGDGTILKAAKKCLSNNAILAGFNLGRVGFLASARNSETFFESFKKILKGDFLKTERIALDVAIIRGKKEIFRSTALNEAVVMNPLGMVNVDVFIENHHLQKIKGTGVMAATPTGSTGFNLSAHGPVMMPDIRGLILVELFDHNIPTPPIILNENQEIIFKIGSFRKRNLLIAKNAKRGADVILISDGDSICDLTEGDIIKIKKSPKSIIFAELESNHFLKSLQEKFDYK